MDSFACTGATALPLSSNQIIVTQQRLVAVKLGYAAQPLLIGLVLVRSERLCQTTAVFGDFPAGIIQSAPETR